MTIAILNVAEFYELLLKANGVSADVNIAGPDQLASSEAPFRHDEWRGGAAGGTWGGAELEAI
jgi:hypothetical protein